MKKDHEIFIAQQIAEFRGKTLEGIDRINAHLKELNGKVAAHSAWIGKQEERNAYGEGERFGEEKFEKRLSNRVKLALLLLSGVIGILSYMLLMK